MTGVGLVPRREVWKRHWLLRGTGGLGDTPRPVSHLPQPLARWDSSWEYCAVGSVLQVLRVLVRRHGGGQKRVYFKVGERKEGRCLNTVCANRTRGVTRPEHFLGPLPQQGPAPSRGPLPGPEKAPDPSRTRGFVVGDRAWEIRMVAENLPQPTLGALGSCTPRTWDPTGQGRGGGRPGLRPS